MEETLYTRNNLIVAFFIGLVIGLGGYYAWDNLPQNADAEQNGQRTETENSNGRNNNNTQQEDEQNGNGVELGANSVQAPDQPAGLRVIIDKLTVDQNSWVAIHEDIDGVPGNILGAARFDAGEYEDEVVNLLRNTEEGSTYYAMIYADDGDKEFDHEKDLPVTGSQDTPIMDVFRAVPLR